MANSRYRLMEASWNQDLLAGRDTGGRGDVAEQATILEPWGSDRVVARLGALHPASWLAAYVRQAVTADAICALAAGLLAFHIRFSGPHHRTRTYLLFSLLLPVIWVVAVAVADGYDARFIGVGSDEFRRLINAGAFLTAAMAILAYATKADLARGYVVVAMPSLVAMDLLARFTLRKRLHKVRRLGSCMRRVLVVGHADVVADLAALLRRDSYHGLSVVAACIVGPAPGSQRIGVPVVAGMDDLLGTIERYEADTVAVLACPEISGVRLREMAWDMEKVGADLCVAPALMDVAGPRTTIRPAAGLPLLHVDHPEFTGARRLIKSCFDGALAGSALLLLLPFLTVVALIIKCADRGPVLFRQTRIGRDGRSFTLYKFRSMVVGAESRKADLAELNETDGALFKMRKDPRVTRFGAWMRKYSVDELPQLINVLGGHMSLVGPRPWTAMPYEQALVDEYGHYVRRRLAVKPGLTGLWQVNGRADLPWDESVRLDLRYVENWSLALDLEILWKTGRAVVRGAGAY